MSIRTRKFIGMVACVTFLIVYCLVVMAVGGAYFTNMWLPVQLLFFVVGGLAWLPVIMWIIRWMQKVPG